MRRTIPTRIFQNTRPTEETVQTLQNQINHLHQCIIDKGNQSYARILQLKAQKNEEIFHLETKNKSTERRVAWLE